ncbi:MAG: VirB3 family type IV secretion system protein [Sulfuriferula sp.]
MRLNVRRTPVATRLSEVKMLAGGEFKLVMANAAFAFVVMALLHIWQYGLVAILIHLTLVIAARSDKQTREIYLEYIKQGERYVPWPEPVLQKQNQRPVGYGRKEEI